MRCLRFLCKICGRDALLPKSLTIPLSCDRSKDPLCHGGFADVWKGVSRDLEVAVKVLKSYQCNQEQIRKASSRKPPLPAACIDRLTTTSIGVLQGSCDVERTSSSERVAPTRGGYGWGSIHDGVGVDGEW